MGKTLKSLILKVTLSAIFVTLYPAIIDARTDEEHIKIVQGKDKVDIAVELGLKWMISKQNKKRGNFEGKYTNAYTGLACIALMSAGHFPGRSKYGKNLRLGLLYLVEEALKNNGYLGDDKSNMYGHGICTLALTEAYGMLSEREDNIKIKKGIEATLKVIINSQSNSRTRDFGGWRYNPNSKDADLSITVWQVLALRSAQNCQLKLPEIAIKNALKYVRSTYSPNIPGFCYQQNHGNSPSMRTAGVVCMLALGADEDEADKKMIEQSAKFLLGATIDPKKHFYYQVYYLATAANMLGGEYRKQVLPEIALKLITLQKPSGEFVKYRGHDGGVYSTAFSIIALSVRYQYLPIYQE